MMQLPESQDDSQYQDERRNLSLLDAWKFQFAISLRIQQSLLGLLRLGRFAGETSATQPQKINQCSHNWSGSR